MSMGTVWWFWSDGVAVFVSGFGRMNGLCARVGVCFVGGGGGVEFSAARSWEETRLRRRWE